MRKSYEQQASNQQRRTKLDNETTSSGEGSRLTVIVDEIFDVAHDLYVSLVRRSGHFGNRSRRSDILLPRGGGLGMQHEGHGQETLWPLQSAYRYRKGYMDIRLP